MELKSIHIKNFKGFQDETFKFSGKFTLLIGDSGTGKTSVLEAVSVDLGGYLAGLGIQSRNIRLEEVRREREVLDDATELQFPVEISCVAKVNEAILHWKRTLHGEKGKTTHKFAKEITEHARNLQTMIRQKQNDLILPLIAYMSATRTWPQSKDKWETPFEKEELSRFMGYTNCLDTEPNIKLFVRWLRRMQLVQIQKNKPIGELNAVVEALKTFLQELLEKDVFIYYDFSEEEVMIDFDDSNLPLRMMSTDYRSVIGLVADLAYRMALLNPHLKEQATKQTPGIVLIDEIELHMRSKWQWKIAKVLKSTFPEIQFIATTHSPIVIASCKDNDLANIETLSVPKRPHHF